MNDQRRVPSLDGLRGLSILLVILGHLVETARFPHLLDPLAGLGFIGVTTFFVVSGYLITALLMQELARTGDVSLARFYLRRALRILPVAYVYIGVVAALAALKLIALRPHDLPFALLFLMDYHHDRAWYLGHFWSLSVEEQFYALWPPLILLLGIDKARVAALALFVFVTLSPSVTPRLFPSLDPRVHLPTGAGSIAAGCLLALWFDWLGARRVFASRWWSAALVGVVSLQIYLWNTRREIHGVNVAIDILIALFILRCLVVPKTLVGAILASPMLTTVGTLSYSIYVWQQLFLNRASPNSVFPFNLLLALATAVVAHLVVERPFLRLKTALALPSK